MFRSVGLLRTLRDAAKRTLAPVPSFEAAVTTNAVPATWVLASKKGFSASPWDDYEGIQYPLPTAEIGKPAPAFTATALVEQDMKEISLKDFHGKWVVIFFYPKDFTYVCPTEIIAFSDRAAEFEKINTQVIAASCDSAEVHLAWVKTPRKRGGLGHMRIPIVADLTKEISAAYGVLVKEKGIPLRGLFIISPTGTLEQITINNLDIGRSVDETLRLVQALQFVAENGVVCPAGWTPGAKAMKAGPEASQEYFESIDEDDFASGLTAITSQADYDKAISSGGAVVVDFYAPWCGKCRQIAPYVDELVKKFPGVKFYKVDTDDQNLQDLVKAAGVTALPVFKVFKGGKEVATTVGYKKAPLGEAVAKVA